MLGKKENQTRLMPFKTTSSLAITSVFDGYAHQKKIIPDLTRCLSKPQQSTHEKSFAMISRKIVFSFVWEDIGNFMELPMPACLLVYLKIPIKLQRIMKRIAALSNKARVKWPRISSIQP